MIMLNRRQNYVVEMGESFAIKADIRTIRDIRLGLTSTKGFSIFELFGIVKYYINA